MPAIVVILPARPGHSLQSRLNIGHPASAISQVVRDGPVAIDCNLISFSSQLNSYYPDHCRKCRNLCPSSDRPVCSGESWWCPVCSVPWCWGVSWKPSRCFSLLRSEETLKYQSFTQFQFGLDMWEKYLQKHQRGT